MPRSQISLEDFYSNLTQEVISESQSRDLIRPKAFFEICNEELIENAELSNNYEYSFYQNRGVEVSGFDYDDERKILSMIVSQYHSEDEIITLTKDNIDTKFKRLMKFLNMVLDDSYKDIQDNEVFDMAYSINEYIKADMVDKFRFFLITNGSKTRNLRTLENSEIIGKTVEHRVIDLNYFYHNYLDENTGREIEIETQLPCLEIDSQNDEYSSYLSLISGSELADIYEEYGKRLLEQNVRTFLMFRTKVNQGLKVTIKDNPERFFAYNNGITATATDIEVSDGVITKLRGFQIVNGGQTTSSIYNCRKMENLDISQINLQLKLSVIKNKDNHSDFVGRVARYANTQNAIKPSDFFSNSPFHKQFKDWSMRTKTPSADGNQLNTYWYYERLRGEYQNDQAYMSPGKKRAFLAKFPIKIDKAFISKPEISWLQKPNIVAAGVDRATDLFAKTVTKQIETDENAITQDYYKHVIARVIMWKKLEKLVSASDWFPTGGYRAATVNYSIAYLANAVEKTGKYLNFTKIWELQGLPIQLERKLMSIAEEVHESINEQVDGFANLSSWHRREGCWDKLKNDLNISIDNDDSYLIDETIVETQAAEQQADARFVSGIEKQAFVLDRSNRNIWKPLLEFYKQDLESSPMKLDILEKFSTGLMPIPSERQAKIIYDIYIEADDMGWSPEN
jgi:hypothetical protein